MVLVPIVSSAAPLGRLFSWHPGCLCARSTSLTVPSAPGWPSACLDLVKLSLFELGSVRQVNLHEAKTHLSRLVAEAVAGEEFVICKAGKPLVRVTRVEGDTVLPRRRLGLLAGQCSVPDDFDAMAAGAIADSFEGRAAAAEGDAGW
jgi:prevent-host-death family protein